MSTEESRKRRREYQKTKVSMDAKLLYQRRHNDKKKRDGTWQLYYKAHYLVWRALKYGKLVKEDCAICDLPDTEAHYEDYTEPLEVIWLCRYHHKHIEEIKAGIAELTESCNLLN